MENRLSDWRSRSGRLVPGRSLRALRDETMMDFLVGGGCLIGGIYLVEAFGHSFALMNVAAAGLIIFGLYRLVMTLIDMAE